MKNKYFGTEAELSKAIDKVIEEESKIKSQIPSHPRYSAMRTMLDIDIKRLRWLKKKALEEWREVKRDPKIAP